MKLNEKRNKLKVFLNKNKYKILLFFLYIIFIISLAFLLVSIINFKFLLENQGYWNKISIPFFSSFVSFGLILYLIIYFICIKKQKYEFPQKNNYL